MTYKKMMITIAAATLSLAAIATTASAATIKLRKVLVLNTSSTDQYPIFFSGKYLESTFVFQNGATTLSIGFEDTFFAKVKPRDPYIRASYRVGGVFDLLSTERNSAGGLPIFKAIRLDQTITNGNGDVLTFTPDGKVTCQGMCELTTFVSGQGRVGIGVTFSDGRYSVSTIPVPASGLLLLTPLALLFARNRRRQLQV